MKHFTIPLAAYGPVEAAKACGNTTFALIVAALVEARGRRLGSMDLAAMVYADDEDGGPLYARNRIIQVIRDFRPLFRRYGWDVVTPGMGVRRGYGLRLIRPEPQP